MWWWRTVALYWATSRHCKCQSSCAQLLRSSVLLGCFFPMLLCGGGPATMRRCHMNLCHGTQAILPRRFGQQQTSFGAPGQSLRYCALASNIFPMALCHGGASHKALRHGAPASNKPHPAEKSTPVRLAIWRIWAGFANSQHRDAAFATPNDMCAHSSLLQQ